MSQQVLQREIIALSEADNWPDAKTEWELLDVSMGDEPEACLCGYPRIYEVCEIRNRVTGAVAEVGNCCVMHFHDASRLMAAARKVAMDTGASCNPDLLDFSLQRGIITDPEREFYLGIRLKRKLEDPQIDRRTEINRRIQDHLLTPEPALAL